MILLLISIIINIMVIIVIKNYDNNIYSIDKHNNYYNISSNI